LSPKTFLILSGLGAVFVFKLWSFVTRYEVSPEKKYNPSKESRYSSLFLKPMRGTSFLITSTRFIFIEAEDSVGE
jgi:hypothetical protein